MSDPAEHLKMLTVLLDQIGMEGHFRNIESSVLVNAMRYSIYELQKKLDEELRDTQEDIET